MAGIEPVEPAAIKTLRPIAAGDLEEIERELPILVEAVRDQAIELSPIHLAGNHVVDQAREIVCKRERGGRRIGDQRRALIGTDRRGPTYNELRQQQAPFQRTDRWRQCQYLFRQFGSCSLGEDDFILVEIAKRDDARQDRGLPGDEGISRQPAGASGRQIKGRACEFERIIRRRKAWDEFARAQRINENPQKRRRGRDIENTWFGGWHRGE